MKIEIEYLLRGQTKWESRNFSPVEYFDPLDEVDSIDGYDVRSISKYQFQPYLHITDSVEKILFMNIMTEDENSKQIKKMIFLDKKFFFVEMLDYENNEMKYRQINIHSCFSKPEKIESLISLSEVNGVLYPTSCSLSPDLDQIEKFDSIDFSEFKNLIKNK